MAIVNFKNQATDDINNGEKNKRTIKLLPVQLHQKAQIKLAVLNAATTLQDLIEIRGNRFESLKGDRQGEFSIRINDQYRICFKWQGNDAYDVEVTDYH